MNDDLKNFAETHEDLIRSAIRAGLFDDTVKERAYELDVCAMDARYVAAGAK